MRRLLFSVCFLAVTSTLRGVQSIEEIKHDDDKSIEVASEEKENVAESSNEEVPDNLIDDFNEIYKAIVSEIESIEEEYSQEENDEQTETDSKINKNVVNKGAKKPNEDKLKINVETLSKNDNIEEDEEDNEVMEPANKVVPGDEMNKVAADAKASKKDADDTANKIIGNGAVADDKAKDLDSKAKAAEAEKDVISNGEKVADAKNDATGDYVVMKAIDLYNILDLLNEYRRRSMMQAIWVLDMQGGRSEDNRQMNIPDSAFDERPRAEKLMDNLSLENVQSYFTQAKDYITKKIDWDVFHLLLIGICLGLIMSISFELCTSKPKERRVHVPFTQDYYTLEKKAYPAVLPTYEECIHKETKEEKMEREAAEEKAGCTLQ